ncbi:hypothetical protein [Streptomyces sp. NBC_00006]|uniref:hypothetical protein n=1 Tax=Streptomyces sp. NBC_00006 TaxID=2975619 RepID=UPI002B1D7991|nr:hypothetical protein [Streptomyces sp. NBC_00006]
MNTFMPLRRGIADDARRSVPLTGGGTVRLQTSAVLRLDENAFADVLTQPRIEERTGMTVHVMGSPGRMELFPTCPLPSGPIRMLLPKTARGTLFTEAPALVHGGRERCRSVISPLAVSAEAGILPGRAGTPG